MRTSVFRPFMVRLIAALILAAASSFAGAQSASASLCAAPSGYVLGFFNGVWNTPYQAQESMELMRKMLGGSYNGEPIQGQLFYNTTGSVAGSTGWQDVVEVFEQQSAELDGALANRWEYFWEALSGTRTWSDRVAQASPALGGLLSTLNDSLRAKTIAALLSLTSAPPPTASDYAAHYNRISGLVVQRKKLLLVAHSQGNLFVNQAYATAVRVGSAQSVAVVHIAPASTQLHGDYTLSTNDLVITALRALAPVPDGNITIPVSTADISGHQLAATYLDSTRNGREFVHAQLLAALGQLVTPQTNGQDGFFTVTLTWDGPGDVDLHTLEPGGAHVYYANPFGSAGELDTDNTVADGPEHYFASCDPTRLQAGTYQIGINNYNGATGRLATVQVASSQAGVLRTKTLDVGPQRGSAGDASPIPVFTVSVSKDASGTFTVSAQ